MEMRRGGGVLLMKNQESASNATRALAERSVIESHDLRGAVAGIAVVVVGAATAAVPAAGACEGVEEHAAVGTKGDSAAKAAERPEAVSRLSRWRSARSSQLDSDRLSKETLEDDTESVKNVSAVLTAAAFEDLMRRMGSELAGVVGRSLLLVFCIALTRCQSHKADSGPSIEFAHIPLMAQVDEKESTRSLNESETLEQSSRLLFMRTAVHGGGRHVR